MIRKALPTALWIAVTLLTAAFTGFSQGATPWSQNTSPLPAPTGMVNDYAGVLDESTKQQLEQKLRNFRDTTDPKVELAVAIVKTTGDRDIFDYSLAVARGWGIGSKADNNPSALLFIAIDDRKYFTQVSRDLEADLPDGAVGTIQRQYLVPEFKKGNYGKGVSDTLDAYITTIRNKGNAPVAVTTPTPVGGSASSGAGSIFGPLCCVGAILLWIFISFFRSNRGGGSGGHSGGGSFGGALPWIVGGLISNLGSSSSGSSSSWGDSGGGGGFGGFGGGGDFGGGGSGGSW